MGYRRVSLVVQNKCLLGDIVFRSLPYVTLTLVRIQHATPALLFVQHPLHRLAQHSFVCIHGAYLQVCCASLNNGLRLALTVQLRD